MIILIAITAQGEGLDARVDNRFGRCEYIIFYDQDLKEYASRENPSKNASGGAGVNTVEFLSANKVVKVVITGNIGPKAMRALNAADIEVFTASEGTVEEMIKAYHDNKLKKTDEPT